MISSCMMRITKIQYNFKYGSHVVKQGDHSRFHNPCGPDVCVSLNARADVLAPSMVLWGSGPSEGDEVMSVEPSQCHQCPYERDPTERCYSFHHEDTERSVTHQRPSLTLLAPRLERSAPRTEN